MPARRRVREGGEVNRSIGAEADARGQEADRSVGAEAETGRQRRRQAASPAGRREREYDRVETHVDT